LSGTRHTSPDAITHAFDPPVDEYEVHCASLVGENEARGAWGEAKNEEDVNCVLGTAPLVRAMPCHKPRTLLRNSRSACAIL